MAGTVRGGARDNPDVFVGGAAFTVAFTDAGYRATPDGNVLEVNGKLEGGEYVLIVDKNGKLAGFEMDNNKLKMTFTNIIPIDSGTESSSSAEMTTIPETTVSAEETMADVTTTAEVTEAVSETTSNQ